MRMNEEWTPEAVHEASLGFQRACVMIAAAELDVFSTIGSGARRSEELARRLRADPRAMAILLDALVAIGLLEKVGDAYRVPADVSDILTPGGRKRRFYMARHLGRCSRRWVQLSRVVQSGKPADAVLAGLSPEEEHEAFIEAMHEISVPVAGGLVATLGPPRFTHLLDIGGGPGTWTIAFLRAMPGSRATLFDLPEVIPRARKRVAEAGLADRVSLVAGDYLSDALPAGADLAWLGAIIHQNSPEENRRLLRKAREALVPGGNLLIRDVVMEPDRVHPPRGALFAVNMLVSSPGGSTYTFEEIAGWLMEAGFEEPRLWHRDEWMNTVVGATVGASAAQGGSGG